MKDLATCIRTEQPRKGNSSPILYFMMKFDFFSFEKIQVDLEEIHFLVLFSSPTLFRIVCLAIGTLLRYFVARKTYEIYFLLTSNLTDSFIILFT